jgi:hypothetical protein
MERGIVFGTRIFGYHLKQGKLIVNEAEAKTVRLIFDLYLSGMGILLISKELENRGISSPNGGLRWATVSILRILKNEKYIGVLKQKKFVTVDYLSHKRKPNMGEEKIISVENSHTPIVDKAIFDNAQNEIARRRNATIEKSRYSNRHVWSGKIKCAYCNSSLKRKVNNSNTATPQIIWQCSEAERYGKEKINANGKKVGCNCQIIHEQVLRDNFLAVLNLVIENKDKVFKELNEYVRQAIANSPDKSNEIKEIGVGIQKMAMRQSKLIDLCVDGLISKSEFEKTKSQYDKQVAVLQKQWAVLKLDDKSVENLTLKLANIERVIESIVKLREFSESVCGEILSKVVVEGRDKMSFYLTSVENKDPLFFKIPFLLPQSFPL